MTTVVVVAAAVIEHEDRFLLTRRQAGAHLEGYWEFPGGKCEPGETVSGCLVREILEELGVDAVVGDELLATAHAYPDRLVRLHFLRCDLSGPPVPQLGQEMRWAARAELGSLALPPPDAELVRMLVSRGE